MIAKAAPRPGILKVLDGAIRVMLRAATSGERLARTRWRQAGSSTRPLWISSEQTTRSCFSASAAICHNSWRCAVPPGLYGRHRLEVSDAALALIAEAGFDPVFGARPLKRAIQERIENPLSRLILDGTLGAKDRVKVEATKGQISFVKA